MLNLNIFRGLSKNFRIAYNQCSGSRFHKSALGYFSGRTIFDDVDFFDDWRMRPVIFWLAFLRSLLAWYVPQYWQLEVWRNYSNLDIRVNMEEWWLWWLYKLTWTKSVLDVPKYYIATCSVFIYAVALQIVPVSWLMLWAVLWSGALQKTHSWRCWHWTILRTGYSWAQTRPYPISSWGTAERKESAAGR